MRDVVDQRGDECGEQVLNFVTGQGNPVDRCRFLGAFGRGDDGEECVREHRQNGPAVPGEPAAVDGMPIEQISRLVGHSGTSVTELVYRKQIRPVVKDGAMAMDRIFRTGTA